MARYAFDSKMEKDCPCEKDCPDRGAGCAITCTRGYKEYREKKLALYAKREEYAERNQQTAGYMKLKRQAIRREQNRKTWR